MTCIRRLGTTGPVTVSKHGTATRIGSTTMPSQEFSRVILQRVRRAPPWEFFEGVALLATIAYVPMREIHRVVGITTACPSKACRAATGGLLISVSSLLVATGISHTFTSAIMITSIVTVAAFAALTAADEVAWSGYAYVDSAFDSGVLLTVCSTHYRKTLSVPA